MQQEKAVFLDDKTEIILKTFVPRWKKRQALQILNYYAES